MKAPLTPLLYAWILCWTLLPAPAQACQDALPRASRAALRDTPTVAADELELTSRPDSAPAWTIGPFEVARVVDGDTIHVQREGRLERLRLLSVDTEEKLDVGAAGSATKPGTIFGEETSLWAQELYRTLADAEGITRVRLLLPHGQEQRDIFGRLLCHVLLPDGRDFNLLLVRLGKSPYYTKYGYSELAHDEFRAAEARARADLLGIWDPSVNQPRSPGAPAARRPYDLLLPWWEARAQAIEEFRRRSAGVPRDVVWSEASQALAAILAEGPRELTIFGEVDRLFDERDGSLTVLFRGGDRDQRVRARIPAQGRSDHAILDLEGRRAEYRQNYLFVRGPARRTAQGFELESLSPDRWELAGPEPHGAERPQAEPEARDLPAGAGR